MQPPCCKPVKLAVEWVTIEVSWRLFEMVAMQLVKINTFIDI